MSYEIRLSKKADKFLTKLEKSAPHDFDKIDYFLKSTLVTTKNPCALPNSKHLKGLVIIYIGGDLAIIVL